MATHAPILVKKYGNRRLYDTADSRYITLEELSERIRAGADVRVVDVQSGEDLTQATLTQIIIEGRGAGKLLPVSLLVQLIRLGDDALAEFFGRYVTGALDLYLQAKRGAAAVGAYNPFATLPFSASDALARLWMSSPFASAPPAAAPPRAPAPADAEAGPPEPVDGVADDVAALRRELAELRRSVEGDGERRGGRPRPRKKRRG
jgi:polyhydroxyalkanoate synthesis repressor PhaR